MPAHKLVLDEVIDESFKLVAIHCSVEEYKLAFLLNKHLDLRLSRSRRDIDFQIRASRVLFALYTFEDQQKYCNFYLVSNFSKGEYRTTPGENSLFGETEMTVKKTHLLPEFRQVDFFLKIEEEGNEVSEKLLVDKIKEIPQVSTAYFIDIHQIKSKENLIFD
ncbi:IPExxxVDY family protein [Salinimicrobium flavum]|uniref:IPExxxVDY family protein n=1 Tax=Salinimicrobium flavum TaxID=1737065 RepID=A0ABW5IV25_9FLAO